MGRLVGGVIALGLSIGCGSAEECRADDECSDHFACERVYPDDPTRGLCVDDCEGSTGNPSDSLCAPGAACTGDGFRCEPTVGSACTPGDLSTVACNGFLCDPSTMRCIVPTSCTDDAECGAYVCMNAGRGTRGYCAVVCEGVPDTCASGLTCSAATGVCE
ncbi:hypothetical protein [Sandaracinus amylolyticus]|uniref:hypothetical protein n=1 Tax=Sandaracinus amylolyticus TaxID=927083 RepID=UPI001F21B932|nr:hypothetical protein [Sandaracinus amylolyticus]